MRKFQSYPTFHCLQSQIPLSFTLLCVVPASYRLPVKMCKQGGEEWESMLLSAQLDTTQTGGQ
jgi:hypothetical protein